VSDAIDRWLRALDAALAGCGALPRDVAHELEDGLRTAVEAHQRRGLTPRAATAAALAEFGAPDRVARAFVPELVARRSRRVAAALVGTGPLVGVAWLLVLAARLPERLPAAELVRLLVRALPVVPVAVGVTALAAAVVLAVTGPLGAGRGLPPRLAPAAAAAACALTLVVDLLAVVLLAANWTPATPRESALLVLAVACSAGRCAWSWDARRRCLRAGAALA
jgi:hypothetical protein